MDEQLERDTIIVEDETLRDGFTQIPNLILRHPTITPGAKLTYAVLLSYAWTEDRCFPGQTRLAHDLAVTDRSVRTYLQQLEESGLISVKQRGLGKTNVYTIHKLRPENISGLGRKPTPIKTGS